MIPLDIGDRHDREQLCFDLETIKKECPHFVRYLEKAVETTTVCLCDEIRTEWLLKHSGALTDLKKILADIGNPHGVLGESPV